MERVQCRDERVHTVFEQGTYVYRLKGCTAEMNAFTQSLSRESVNSGELNRLKGCNTEINTFTQSLSRESVRCRDEHVHTVIE